MAQSPGDLSKVNFVSEIHKERAYALESLPDFKREAILPVSRQLLPILERILKRIRAPAPGEVVSEADGEQRFLSMWKMRFPDGSFAANEQHFFQLVGGYQFTKLYAENPLPDVPAPKHPDSPDIDIQLATLHGWRINPSDGRWIWLNPSLGNTPTTLFHAIVDPSTGQPTFVLTPFHQAYILFVQQRLVQELAAERTAAPDVFAAIEAAMAPLETARLGPQEQLVSSVNLVGKYAFYCSMRPPSPGPNPICYLKCGLSIKVGEYEDHVLEVTIPQMLHRFKEPPELLDGLPVTPMISLFESQVLSLIDRYRILRGRESSLAYSEGYADLSAQIIEMTTKIRLHAERIAYLLFRLYSTYSSPAFRATYPFGVGRIKEALNMLFFRNDQSSRHYGLLVRPDPTLALSVFQTWRTANPELFDTALEFLFGSSNKPKVEQIKAHLSVGMAAPPPAAVAPGADAEAPVQPVFGVALGAEEEEEEEGGLSEDEGEELAAAAPPAAAQPLPVAAAPLVERNTGSPFTGDRSSPQYDEFGEDEDGPALFQQVELPETMTAAQESSSGGITAEESARTAAEQESRIAAEVAAREEARRAQQKEKRAAAAARRKQRAREAASAPRKEALAFDVERAAVLQKLKSRTPLEEVFVNLVDRRQELEGLLDAEEVGPLSEEQQSSKRLLVAEIENLTKLYDEGKRQLEQESTKGNSGIVKAVKEAAELRRLELAARAKAKAKAAQRRKTDQAYRAAAPSGKRRGQEDAEAEAEERPFILDSLIIEKVCHIYEGVSIAAQPTRITRTILGEGGWVYDGNLSLQSILTYIKKELHPDESKFLVVPMLPSIDKKHQQFFLEDELEDTPEEKQLFLMYEQDTFYYLYYLLFMLQEHFQIGHAIAKLQELYDLAKNPEKYIQDRVDVYKEDEKRAKGNAGKIEQAKRRVEEARAKAARVDREQSFRDYTSMYDTVKRKYLQHLDSLLNGILRMVSLLKLEKSRKELLTKAIHSLIANTEVRAQLAMFIADEDFVVWQYFLSFLLINIITLVANEGQPFTWTDSELKGVPTIHTEFASLSSFSADVNSKDAAGNSTFLFSQSYLQSLIPFFTHTAVPFPYEADELFAQKLSFTMQTLTQFIQSIRACVLSKRILEKLSTLYVGTDTENPNGLGMVLPVYLIFPKDGIASINTGGNVDYFESQLELAGLAQSQCNFPALTLLAPIYSAEDKLPGLIAYAESYLKANPRNAALLDFNLHRVHDFVREELDRVHDNDMLGTVIDFAKEYTPELLSQLGPVFVDSIREEIKQRESKEYTPAPAEVQEERAKAMVTEIYSLLMSLIKQSYESTKEDTFEKFQELFIEILSKAENETAANYLITYFSTITSGAFRERVILKIIYLINQAFEGEGIHRGEENPFQSAIAEFESSGVEVAAEKHDALLSIFIYKKLLENSRIKLDSLFFATLRRWLPFCFEMLMRNNVFCNEEFNESPQLFKFIQKHKGIISIFGFVQDALSELLKMPAPDEASIKQQEQRIKITILGALTKRDTGAVSQAKAFTDEADRIHPLMLFPSSRHDFGGGFEFYGYLNYYNFDDMKSKADAVRAQLKTASKPAAKKKKGGVRKTLRRTRRTRAGTARRRS